MLSSKIKGRGGDSLLSILGNPEQSARLLQTLTDKERAIDEKSKQLHGDLDRVEHLEKLEQEATKARKKAVKALSKLEENENEFVAREQKSIADANERNQILDAKEVDLNDYAAELRDKGQDLDKAVNQHDINLAEFKSSVEHVRALKEEYETKLAKIKASVAGLG